MKANSDLKTDAVWNLAIDGWFISDSPDRIFSAGEQNEIPMMVGLNTGELSPPQSATYFISGYMTMLSGIRKKGAGFEYQNGGERTQFYDTGFYVIGIKWTSYGRRNCWQVEGGRLFFQCND